MSWLIWHRQVEHLPPVHLLNFSVSSLTSEFLHSSNPATPEDEKIIPEHKPQMDKVGRKSCPKVKNSTEHEIFIAPKS